MEAKNVTLEALKWANPTAYMLAKLVGSVTNSEQIMEGAPGPMIPALQEEARRQELQMQMKQAEARFLQEVAIAQRIEDAQEVEIEEFYDGNFEKSLGVKADENAVTLGASGSGRRVTRRVYRFKGNMNPNRPAAPESGQ